MSDSCLMALASKIQAESRYSGEHGEHHGQGQHSEDKRHRKGSLLPVQAIKHRGKTMELQDMKAKFAGKYVQFVGMYGITEGPVGKVWRVTNHGIWVTMPDGSRQQWHPESVNVVPRPAVTPNR